MAESVQERWEALKRRLEARRDERLTAHVASYQTAEKAELSARSARGGARGSTKGAPGGASQRGVSSARDAKLQPPPSSSAKPPQPRRRVASAAPPSAPPRPCRRAPEAMEAALGGVAVEGPPRRAGLVTPLSFLFSRVLVGCACFVAGVAYADSLPGERGVRRRALGRARKSVARSASRVVAQAQPLLTDLQRRVRPALAEAVHTAAALPPLLAEVCQALALRLRALFAPRLPPPPPPPRVAASYDAHAETETEPDVDEAQMLRAGARAVAQSLDIAQEVGGPAMLLGHPADDVDSEEQEAEALQRAVQAASARREALDGGHAQLQHHRQSSEQERRARELEARLMEADAAVRADAFAAASAKALSPPPPRPREPFASPPLLYGMDAATDSTLALRQALDADAVRAQGAAAVARLASDRAQLSQGASLARLGSSAAAAQEVFEMETVAKAQRAEAQAAVVAARARLAEVVALSKRPLPAGGSPVSPRAFHAGDLATLRGDYRSDL